MFLTADRWLLSQKSFITILFKCIKTKSKHFTTTYSTKISTIFFRLFFRFSKNFKTTRWQLHTRPKGNRIAQRPPLKGIATPEKAKQIQIKRKINSCQLWMSENIWDYWHWCCSRCWRSTAAQWRRAVACPAIRRHTFAMRITVSGKESWYACRLSHCDWRTVRNDTLYWPHLARKSLCKY